MPPKHSRYDVVVIGSGFGGAMVALSLAHAMKARGRKDTILVMERGTWWITPVSTLQDPEGKTHTFLTEDPRKQPVQYWSSIDHFRGLVDILLRCHRRKGNEDGLYELTSFGTRGFLGFGRKSDGVSILRACGVGGGSLVYANVTIQPPDCVFEDPRWLGWDAASREKYFTLASDAIGHSVVWAREKEAGTATGAPRVNPGLKNIVTRTIGLEPHFADAKVPEPRIDPSQKNSEWLERPRVFQTAMSRITRDFGTVRSSINSYTLDSGKSPENYCERQGRCILGCLPGARYTINKQFLRVAYGSPFPGPDGKPVDAYYDGVEIGALAEVDVIEALAGGGYRIHYLQRHTDDPSRFDRVTVDATRVVVAAGCVGTNEIMLRSAARGTLKHLSPRLGHGFSTNGDYLGFVEGTTLRVNLTRGPVTTSFGHFNNPEAGTGGDPALFHTIEDNGIPRPFATLVGAGIPLLRALANGRHPWWIVVKAVLLYGWKQFVRAWRGLRTNHRVRSEFFHSEDERLARMMCVAGIGRDEARGQFRLGSRGDTTLRVARDDGKAFHDDPIYPAMKTSLDEFARELAGPGSTFISPFLSEAADALKAKSVTLSHPLGGCRMGASPDEGVVDASGRVFDTSAGGAVHPGLYVADGSIVPTSLGVNPSLTISALALRCADGIIREMESEGGGR
jgi:choline dehydrogenase-like flavoprotein